MCLMNIAGSSKFSSDRAVQKYARDIWEVPYERIELPPPSLDPISTSGEMIQPSENSEDKISIPVQ